MSELTSIILLDSNCISSCHTSWAGINIEDLDLEPYVFNYVSLISRSRHNIKFNSDLSLRLWPWKNGLHYLYSLSVLAAWPDLDSVYFVHACLEKVFFAYKTISRTALSLIQNNITSPMWRRAHSAIHFSTLIDRPRPSLLNSILHSVLCSV